MAELALIAALAAVGYTLSRDEFVEGNEGYDEFVDRIEGYVVDEVPATTHELLSLTPFFWNRSITAPS